MQKKIRRMRESSYKEFELYYKIGKKLKPIRICIYRKDKNDVEKSLRDVTKANSRAGRGKISEKQKFYAKYVIIATSLTESADKILELYRLRWQIELLFKRLKSIFDLDELKAKKPESVRVWFYCKLLLAAICEALDNMGRFSPYSQFMPISVEQME
jgi:IS4 transposase